MNPVNDKLQVFPMKKPIVLFLCMLLAGCGQRWSCKLPQLFDEAFTPPRGTYKLALSVQGDFSCPFERNTEVRGRDADHFIFTGKTDTLVTGDWYEEELSFRTSTPECMDQDGTVSIEFYYIR